jgi:hypothetical protein
MKNIIQILTMASRITMEVNKNRNEVLSEGI